MTSGSLKGSRTYLPKVYGFFLNHTNSKTMAEELLIRVFLEVWADIKTFNDDNEEKKIALCVILTCRHSHITLKQ